jgi:bacillithiol biosynthesis cysteine-adding enzyme BshC
LENQYKQVAHSTEVKENIQLLLKENCFTITTAHQNNIFTGPLYFIYKILHVIKLANELTKLIPDACFVPVFYLGSEDADLQELNHLQVNGKVLQWDTTQKGAVGRMNVDSSLVNLKEEVKKILQNFPASTSVNELLDKACKEGVTIADFTFSLVNELFGKYGLVVLQPDQPALKKQMGSVFQQELLKSNIISIVENTSASLEKKGYKVQASPRAINLFYLIDDCRERMEKKGNEWVVNNTTLKFTEQELLQELSLHPERFSPNVILRPLFQSTILPDIAFVGGGGELAYWLQLKPVFESIGIPYPVVVLRNSFLLLNQQQVKMLEKLKLDPAQLFLSEQQLMANWLQLNGETIVDLQEEKNKIAKSYQAMSDKVGAIDPTLKIHLQALAEKAANKLAEVDKKVLRSQKKKYPEQQLNISLLKQILFPANGLQERSDNVLTYLATWGIDFLDVLLGQSMALEQEFVILEEI